MKKFSFLAILITLALGVKGQKYEITFTLPGVEDNMLFLSQHYRDGFIDLDSASRSENGTYIFRGKRKFETGIYAIHKRNDKKGLLDFTIDGSQRFSIKTTANQHIANPQTDIIGSPANQAMYAYINKVSQAKQQVKDIDQRKKSANPAVRAQAEKDMDALTQEMNAYEDGILKNPNHYRFFELLNIFKGPDVPDEVEDKAVYYRTHFWDGVDLSDHSLVRTPDLFNKMNYYFFGVLYHADYDTICLYADRILQKIENDTLMLRYFMDYIMPRYYRSTKNIGWDATWCYLVRKYYLSGKCSWASQSDLINKKQNVEFLEKSLIGAMGAELYMADTNQSPDPNDWISSHRFPQKYVILWFWDPDCHHCQEQTATLKTLYDSLSAAGNKIFEVYAVGYESDVAKWKKYVKEHNLPFVNVGGNNVNIDYQEAYNVHGAPTMIILNEERRIIMNKVLPTKGILPFLKQYEENRKK